VIRAPWHPARGAAAGDRPIARSTSGDDLSGAHDLVSTATRSTSSSDGGRSTDGAAQRDVVRGTVVSRFKDPALALRATAVRIGTDLVVVSTQFNTRENDAAAPAMYTLPLPVSRLGGR
jgi:hypothetical protein